MYGLFLLHLLLAFLWMCLWGLFDIWSLLSGLIVGWLVLLHFGRTTGHGRGYGDRGWRLFMFLLYFIRILIKANLQVAWEVLTPTHGMRPRFVQYPVEGMTPGQVTLLASTISLTPGTLSVDVDDQGQWLLIHCMYAATREDAIRELDDLRNRIVKEILT